MFPFIISRVSYSILKNQLAIYPKLQIDNSQDQVEIKNLSPGSAYTFRFNVQMGPMSGPSVHKQVSSLVVEFHMGSDEHPPRVF